MRIHHVNAATLCPFGQKAVNGSGSWLARGHMVCHCLIVERSDGLVLIDTGLGAQDVADPKGRLGGPFCALTRPAARAQETMLAHVQRLGFAASDVRHIVLTHMDLDHAGGVLDFPKALVHVHQKEHAAALARATTAEANRYRPAQWTGAQWALHQEDGERWLGFDAVKALPGDDVLLIPLHGHSRGHVGVAVQGPDGWLLHGGDAWFSHRDLQGDGSQTPVGLRLFQRLAAFDNAARLHNQQRLRSLVIEHPQVQAFGAHCPVEFARFSGVAS